MKRALVCLFVSLIFTAGVPLRAADAVTLAAQQEIIESNKRLLATVEELQNTQAEQQKHVSALKAELGKLRDELARNNSDAAIKESLRKLNDQIVKVDEARIADGKRFQEALERLGETFKKVLNSKPARPVGVSDNTTSGAGSSGGRGTPPRGAETAGGSDEGFPYVVVSGDRPDKIAAKFQADKINVSASSIIKANPSVDWSKLQVGQKLFIPKPK